jgi:hypothetical protein
MRHPTDMLFPPYDHANLNLREEDDHRRVLAVVAYLGAR